MNPHSLRSVVADDALLDRIGARATRKPHDSVPPRSSRSTASPCRSDPQALGDLSSDPVARLLIALTERADAPLEPPPRQGRRTRRGRHRHRAASALMALVMAGSGAGVAAAVGEPEPVPRAAAPDGGGLTFRWWSVIKPSLADGSELGALGERSTFERSSSPPAQPTQSEPTAHQRQPDPARSRSSRPAASPQPTKPTKAVTRQRTRALQASQPVERTPVTKQVRVATVAHASKPATAARATQVVKPTIIRPSVAPRHVAPARPVAVPAARPAAAPAAVQQAKRVEVRAPLQPIVGPARDVAVDSAAARVSASSQSWRPTTHEPDQSGRDARSRGVQRSATPERSKGFEVSVVGRASALPDAARGSTQQATSDRRPSQLEADRSVGRHAQPNPRPARERRDSATVSTRMSRGAGATAHADERGATCAADTSDSRSERRPSGGGDRPRR